MEGIAEKILVNEEIKSLSSEMKGLFPDLKIPHDRIAHELMSIVFILDGENEKAEKEIKHVFNSMMKREPSTKLSKVFWNSSLLHLLVVDDFSTYFSILSSIPPLLLKESPEFADLPLILPLESCMAQGLLDKCQAQLAILNKHETGGKFIMDILLKRFHRQMIQKMTEAILVSTKDHSIPLSESPEFADLPLILPLESCMAQGLLDKCQAQLAILNKHETGGKFIMDILLKRFHRQMIQKMTEAILVSTKDHSIPLSVLLSDDSISREDIQLKESWCIEDDCVRLKEKIVGDTISAEELLLDAADAIRDLKEVSTTPYQKEAEIISDPLREAWDTFFSHQKITGYNDRHHLYSIIPEIFPIPIHKSTLDVVCQKYVCHCGNTFDIEKKETIHSITCPKCGWNVAYEGKFDPKALAGVKKKFLSFPFAPFLPFSMDELAQLEHGYPVTAVSSPSSSSCSHSRSHAYVLDLGCGVGNTSFPLHEKTGKIFCTMIDWSVESIEVVRRRPRYDDSRMFAISSDATLGEQMKMKIINERKRRIEEATKIDIALAIEKQGNPSCEEEKKEKDITTNHDQPDIEITLPEIEKESITLGGKRRISSSIDSGDDVMKSSSVDGPLEVVPSITSKPEKESITLGGKRRISSSIDSGDDVMKSSSVDGPLEVVPSITSKPGTISPILPPLMHDYSLSIFLYSALPPEKHASLLSSSLMLVQSLGTIVIYDYAWGDMRSSKFGAKEPNSSITRKDGTLVCFFTKSYFQELIKKVGGCKIEECTLRESVGKNRKTGSSVFAPKMPPQPSSSQTSKKSKKNTRKHRRRQAKMSIKDLSVNLSNAIKYHRKSLKSSTIDLLEFISYDMEQLVKLFDTVFKAKGGFTMSLRLCLSSMEKQGKLMTKRIADVRKDKIPKEIESCIQNIEEGRDFILGSTIVAVKSKKETEAKRTTVQKMFTPVGLAITVVGAGAILSFVLYCITVGKIKIEF
ncbi:Methyltransferase-like protein [Aduncisulcus paluster]|uniref:Methyltransferase-like protein n=1 Tax=Aduncisulcus paluster TaxID=2918883 RepID=A0ABQ5K8F1_9EUKA|nr:Methyltransferase-like protein [Aduncisulcus paluster]